MSDGAVANAMLCCNHIFVRIKDDFQNVLLIPPCTIKEKNLPCFVSIVKI